MDTQKTVIGPERFAQMREAFHGLLDVDPMQRSEALSGIEAEDPAMAGDLRELLAQLDESDLVAAPSRTPSQLGPFRLLQCIGSGGMGDVFLAERVDGAFEQQVALKLVRDVAINPESTRRFLRERRILARLAHPNIARLIDGGFADDGRPWLAMEFVHGQRINDWCAEHRLDAVARVRLFLPLCDAVQFAHRNLIVHRDLKPANLMVNGEGRVMLLDFGIARLLDGDGTDPTQTRAAMTPAYAAPEQRDGGEITTATDVYQLGAVLLELISGARPNVARTGTLPAVLRGDLGLVIDKAMAMRPSDRYGSAALLADDLSDWLAKRPLRSGIGSRRERLRKSLWQWRWPLAAVTTIMMLIGVGMWLVLREARARQLEAEVSAQTTAFLIDLFEGADPSLSRGSGLSAQDLLDQGNARLHGETRLQPTVRARLLRTVADSYVALGHYDRALAPAEDALTARRSTGTTIEIADSLDQVGNILRLKADYPGAEPLLREALALRRDGLEADAPDTIDSLAHLAALHSAKGEFKSADALFAEAAKAAQRRFGEDSVITARHLDAYAGNLDDMGQRTEALALLRRALAIRERVLGGDHADVATTLQSLGVHLSASGHHDEAVLLLERALDIRTRIYGSSHPLVAFTEIDLAGAYAEQLRLAEAEDLAQKALTTVRAALSPDHPKVSEALNMLALIRIIRRDYVGAIGLQQEVVQRYATTAGEDHPDTLTAKNNLAYALLHADRAAEAETLLRDVIGRKRGDNGQGSAHDHQNLATALSAQNKHDEALVWQERAVAIQISREGRNSAATAVALRELAVTMDWAGKGTEAAYREALNAAEAVGEQSGLSLRGWQLPLATYLVGSKHCAAARPHLEQALLQLEKEPAESDSIGQPQVRLLLESCSDNAGSPDHRAAISRHCRTLLAVPGVSVDVYPTTRRLLGSICTGDAVR